MLIGLGLAGALVGRVVAADDTWTLDDVVDSAQEWATNNLDDGALRMLEGEGQARTRQLLDEIERRFHGEYVLDLGQLRETANQVIPLLEAHPETKPYVVWIRTRLDYLDAADELRLIIPLPKPIPGVAPVPAPNPPAEKEREVWTKKMADRPWPEAAKPVVAKLKPVFVEEKVPPELVWIAEVESSFDAGAKSPAGAAGLFQLMPDTAKRYGLRTWPFDQRYNAEDSGRAAARCLAALHRKFQDWRLAVAAYNAGEGTVQNQLKRRNAKTFDEISPYLPAETQMYVPKVEATILRREGVKLEELR